MDRFIIEKLIEILFVIFLVLISIKDFKEKIIPDRYTLGITALGTAKILFCSGDFEKSFIGMGTYPIIFLIIYGYVSDLIKKETIGFGDIKLLGAAGFYMEYSGIYKLIILHNLIFISGFLFVLPALLFKKAERNSEIPFAPFICMGILLYRYMVKL